MLYLKVIIIQREGVLTKTERVKEPYGKSLLCNVNFKNIKIRCRGLGGKGACWKSDSLSYPWDLHGKINSICML